MGILPAILADARGITLDVTGLQCGLIEGRCEQESQPIIPQEQLIISRCHGAHGARRIGRTGDHSPGLSNGVDAALAARCSAKRCSVIEIATAIPIAIPTVALKGVSQRSRVPPPGCGTIVLTPLLCKCNEILDGSVKKPTQPYTLPLPANSHSIETVIPVSGSDERQAMDSNCETRFQCTRAMFVERLLIL